MHVFLSQRLGFSILQVQDLEASGLLSLLARLPAPLEVLSLRDNGLKTLRGLGAAAQAACSSGSSGNSEDAAAATGSTGGDGLLAGLSTSSSHSLALGLRELSLDVNKLARLEACELNPWAASLERLSVASNHLNDWPSASSPGGALTLPVLQRFDAHHNQLRNLPAGALGGLPRLVHLDLGRNLLGPDLRGATLSAAKCLETLVLSQNKLERLPAPLRLPLLRKLWLGSNRLLDMSAWADDGSSTNSSSSSSSSSSSRSSSSGSSSTSNGNNGNGRSEGADGVDGAAGAAAREATWLPSLECLHLDSNRLACLPPGCLVGLPLLRLLDLSFNSLPHDPPPRWLHEHQQRHQHYPQPLLEADSAPEPSNAASGGASTAAGPLEPRPKELQRGK